MTWTFGNTTPGSSNISPQDDYRGIKATCIEKCTADRMYAYLSSWSAGEKVQCAIYNADTDTFIASTNERADGGSGWESFNFPYPQPQLRANQDYYLLLAADSHMWFPYTTLANMGVSRASITYGTWNQPSNVSSSNSYHSIYCVVRHSNLRKMDSAVFGKMRFGHFRFGVKNPNHWETLKKKVEGLST